MDFMLNLLTVPGMAYVVSFLALAMQIAYTSFYLRKYVSNLAMLTLVADAPLLVHVAWFWREESAARASPVQWMAYSWLHAAKVVVLFCKVMPLLPNEDQTSGTNVGDEVFAFGAVGAITFGNGDVSVRMLANVLLCAPVFYALIMFRTSKAIFGRSSSRITVDLLLHYDMLWHVVIDMVDQVDMFCYARLSDWVPAQKLDENSVALATIQNLIPLFLFLSVVLQGQSLPGVVVDEWHIPELPPLQPETLRADASEQTRTPTMNFPAGSAGAVATAAALASSADNAPLAAASSGPLTALAATTRGQLQMPTLPPLPSGPSAGTRLPPMKGPLQEDRHGGEVLSPKSPSSHGTEEFARATSSGSSNATKKLSGPLEPPRAPRPLPLSPVRELSEFGARSYGALQGLAASRSRLDLSARWRSTGLYSSVSTVEASRPLARCNWARSPSPFAAHHARLVKLEKRRQRRLQEIIQKIQRQSVIIARKRSAIVSIFFIDAPFLAFRLGIFFIAMGGQYTEFNRFFPALGVKNGVCLVLNLVLVTLLRPLYPKTCQDIEALLARYQLKYCSSPGPANAAVGATTGSDAGRRSRGSARDQTPPPAAEDGAVAVSTTPPRGNQGSAPPLLSPAAASDPSGVSLISSAEVHRAAAATRNTGSSRPSLSPALSEDSLGKDSSPGSIGGFSAGASSPRASHRRALREAQRSIRQKSRRNPSVCVHFWVLIVAFGIGASSGHLIKIDGDSLENMRSWLESIAELVEDYAHR